jgi:RNase adaptor protein for sRNA GlmZ degradation
MDLPQNDSQQILHEKHHFVVEFVSHARNPPVKPPPGTKFLKFSVRHLPSPPKHSRDRFTGKDKRLQEWVLGTNEAKAWMDSATKEIADNLQAIQEQKVISENSHAENGRVAVVSKGVHGEHGVSVEENHLQKRATDAKEEENPEPESEPELESENENEEAKVQQTSDLLVSVFCEEGKHRSVALMEQLARHSWPKDWDVQVWHRDVDKIHGKHRRQGGKSDQQRGPGKRSGGFVSDE